MRESIRSVAEGAERVWSCTKIEGCRAGRPWIGRRCTALLVRPLARAAARRRCVVGPWNLGSALYDPARQGGFERAAHTLAEPLPHFEQAASRRSAGLGG